jgi:hypothetical protein
LTTPKTVAEPQARPAAAGLGGEERLEEAAADLLAHTGAAVGDRQQHVRAGRHVAVGGDVALVELDVRGGDRQPPAAGHRVARVGGEVEYDALDLGAVGLDRRDALAELDRELHVVADDPLEHRAHAAHDLVHVDGRRVQDLAAAEGEQLPGQRARLLGGVLDLVRAARSLRASRAGSRRSPRSRSAGC